MSDFSNYLKDYMNNNDITQRELAERLGVSKSTVCKYVTGDREPSTRIKSRYKRCLEYYDGIYPTPAVIVRNNEVEYLPDFDKTLKAFELGALDPEHQEKLQKILGNEHTRQLLINYIDKLWEVV